VSRVNVAPIRRPFVVARPARSHLLPAGGRPRLVCAGENGSGWRGCHRVGYQLCAGHGVGVPPAGCDSPRSNARTSDSRNLRCPPGVRMLLIRPDAAHRVTVFGSTRKSAATSPGVRRRSLLPSTDLPSLSPFRSMSSVSRKHPFTSLFSPKMSRWCPLSASAGPARGPAPRLCRPISPAVHGKWQDVPARCRSCRAMYNARLQNVQGDI
jgi:hypothetical protein